MTGTFSGPLDGMREAFSNGKDLQDLSYPSRTDGFLSDVVLRQMLLCSPCCSKLSDVAGGVLQVKSTGEARSGSQPHRQSPKRKGSAIGTGKGRLSREILSPLYCTHSHIESRTGKRVEPAMCQQRTPLSGVRRKSPLTYDLYDLWQARFLLCCLVNFFHVLIAALGDKIEDQVLVYVPLLVRQGTDVCSLSAA